MAQQITDRDRIYLQKLTARGYDSEKAIGMLNLARQRHGLAPIEQRSMFTNAAFGFTRGLGNVAVTTVGKTQDAFTPGDQSQDPNGAYNKGRRAMDEIFGGNSQVENILKGFSPDSTSSKVGEFAGAVLPTIPVSLGAGSLIQGGLAAGGRALGTSSMIGRGFNAASNIAKVPGLNAGAGQLAKFGVYEGVKDQAVFDLMNEGKTNLGSLAVGGLAGGILAPTIGGISKIGKRNKTFVGETSAGMKDSLGSIVNLSKRLDKTYRINPTEYEKFAKITGGKSIGQFAAERGVVATPEEAVIEFTKRGRASMAEADKGLDMIEGTYTNDKLKKILLELHDEALATESDAIAKRASELYNKHENGGLTMKEINEAKRLFEKENTFNYLRNNEARAYKRATNLDNALREWQMKTAELNGFDTLRAVNKETQANMAAARAIQSKLTRQMGNNEFGITDWIMAAGALDNPAALGALIGKRLISSDMGQKMYNKLLQKFDNTTQITPPVANIDQIGNMQSFKKKFNDGIPRLPTPRSSSRSGTRLNPDVKLPGGEIVKDSVRTKLTDPFAAPEITPRSKIIYPGEGGYAVPRPKPKLLPPPRLPEGTSYPRTDASAQSLRESIIRPRTQIKVTVDKPKLKTNADLPNKKRVIKNPMKGFKKVIGKDGLVEYVTNKKNTPPKNTREGSLRDMFRKKYGDQGDDLMNAAQKLIKGDDIEFSGIGRKDAKPKAGTLVKPFTDKDLFGTPSNRKRVAEFRRDIENSAEELNIDPDRLANQIVDDLEEWTKSKNSRKSIDQQEAEYNARQSYNDSVYQQSLGLSEPKNFPAEVEKFLKTDRQGGKPLHEGTIKSDMVKTKTDLASLKKSIKDEETNNVLRDFKEGTTGKTHAMEPKAWLIKKYEDKIASIKKSVERTRGYLDKASKDPEYARMNRKNISEWKRYIEHWSKEGKYSEYFNANTKELGEIGRKEYGKYIREAMTRGEEIPAGVLANPEYRKIHEGQLKYLKGRNTSFANKSDMVQDTDFGVKVKRQDGKPIKPEQVEEIRQSLAEFEKAHGNIQDILKKMDLTIAHTSGKNPFLKKDVGGLYSSTDKRITVGVNSAMSVLRGKPEYIRAFTHELTHAIDDFAGDMTRSFSELEKHYNPSLIRRAQETMQTERFGTVSLKENKGMNPEQIAGVKDKKTRLGEYWNRPNELFARMVEQLTAYKLGNLSKLAQDSFESYTGQVGYWTKSEFEKLAPSIEQELQRKFHNIRNPEKKKEAELLLIMLGIPRTPPIKTD